MSFHGLLGASLALSTATAAPRSWADEPVATELHPVAAQPFVHRWHARMEDQMAGPRASSTFRSMSSRMDVLLRIAEFEGQMPWVSQDGQRRALQLAINGATLGWQVALGDVVNQSDELSAARGRVRSLFNPAVSRGTSPEAQSSAMVSDAVVQGAVTDPTAWRSDSTAPRKPAVRTGLGGMIANNLDPALTGGGYDEGERPYSLVGRGFVQVDNVGLDTLRVQVSGRPGVGFEALGVNWTALGRHELTSRLALVGQLQGGTGDVFTPQDDLSPHFAQGALDLRVAPERGWILRTALSRADRGELGQERIAGVSFRINSRWRLPWSPSERRGQVDATGAPLPWLPDRSPLDVAPAAQRPIDRLADALGSEPPSDPGRVAAR